MLNQQYQQTRLENNAANKGSAELDQSIYKEIQYYIPCLKHMNKMTQII